MKTIRNISLMCLVGIMLTISSNLLGSDSTVKEDNNPILCIISDTQAPLWVEKIFRKSEKNEEATDSLFRDIIREHPKSLFITGDLVGASISNSFWKPLEKKLETLRNSNIPVYAVPGNHEYMFLKNKAKENYFKRFPKETERGYFKVIDSIAVVMLNSSLEKLSASDIKFQNDWYSRTMDSLNKTGAVKLIIVACHYSPFTNSTEVTDMKVVQDNFIPKYLECEKAKLFVSGHSHNLEHIVYKNKDFLVIGGGGGPEQPLKKPEKQSWKDEISNEVKPRFFYIMVEKQQGDISVVARGVKDDFSKFTERKILSLK